MDSGQVWGVGRGWITRQGCTGRAAGKPLPSIWVWVTGLEAGALQLVQKGPRTEAIRLNQPRPLVFYQQLRAVACSDHYGHKMAPKAKWWRHQD